MASRSFDASVIPAAGIDARTRVRIAAVAPTLLPTASKLHCINLDQQKNYTEHMAVNDNLLRATQVTSRALPSSTTLLGHKKAVASVHELGSIIVGIVTESSKHYRAGKVEGDCRWLIKHLSDIVSRLGPELLAALSSGIFGA